MLRILCPVDGMVIVPSKIPDQTFSKHLMGPTIAVVPYNGKFICPINGEVVIANGHAFGIKTNNGIQVLIHIGIDTVKITPRVKERVFKHKIKPGDKVKAGQLMVEVDLKAIKKLGYNTMTPVCILSESLQKGHDVNFATIGKSTKEDCLFTVE